MTQRILNARQTPEDEVKVEEQAPLDRAVALTPGRVILPSVPPYGDQGATGTCVAWAARAVYMWQYRKQFGSWPNLDVFAFYDHMKKVDGEPDPERMKGMFLLTALRVMKPSRQCRRRRETGDLERLAYLFEQLFFLDGLGQERERATPGRADGVGDRPVRGQQDHGQHGVTPLQLLEEREAIHLGHAQVGEHAEKVTCETLAREYYTKSSSCFSCRVGCMKSWEVKEGPYAGLTGTKIPEGCNPPNGPNCGNAYAPSLFKITISATSMALTCLISDASWPA